MGEGNGNPLQHPCLENSMDRGAWWASLCSRKELDMTEVTSHIHTLPFGLGWFFLFYHIKNNLPLLAYEIFLLWWLVIYIQFSSVAQSCLTLCYPTDCSTPGFPVHHKILELAQTHVHNNIELVMPSNHLILCHPLLLPSIFPSIRVFSNESFHHK